MFIGRAILGVGVALTLAGASQAAAFRISPIGVEIPAAQRAETVTVTNTDVEPVNLQVRIFKWSQVDGEDRLDPTNEVIASPPAASIPAGKSYTIRIARRAIGPVATEQTYRLFIDELPKPIDPKASGQGVSMVLRTSMPVFVVDKKQSATLNWRVWSDVKGVHVEASNSGQRHGRISSLKLQQGGGAAVDFGSGLNGYVLPGAQKIFTVKPAEGAAPSSMKVGSEVMLTAVNEGQEIKTTVVVQGG